MNYTLLSFEEKVRVGEIVPSCCIVGVCLMYNWSPNCLKLLSKIVSMSFFSVARAVVTARRIAMPQPTPAPVDDVIHVIT